MRYLAGLLALCLLMASCSKDKNDKNTFSCQLTSAEGGGAGYNLTYDSKGRLIKLEYPGNASYDELIYNSQGQLTEFNSYYNSGELDARDLYTHNGNSIQGQSFYDMDTDGTLDLSSTSTTTINSKGQPTVVETIDYEYDDITGDTTTEKSKDEYTWNGDGNLTSEKGYTWNGSGYELTSQRTYTYDDKLNPFSGLDDLRWLIVYSANNVAVETSSFYTPWYSDTTTTTYTYQYNEHNFPLVETRADVDDPTDVDVTAYYYNCD